jgi:SAM-dependent methyltransferase
VTVQVLQSQSEIAAARQELRQRGLSCIPNGWVKKLRNRGLLKGLSVGDEIKSWDVLNTTLFLQENVARASPVLDIGAFASEILVVLHRLKYSELSGVDLDARLRFMPHKEATRYAIADFMHSPFRAGTFAAITAMSVLEHGFQSRSLLLELARLLRPGGYFVASFDYWPSKIDTSGIDIFGMSWTIFSEAEVRGFLTDARRYGLNLCGPAQLGAQQPLIETAGKRYTFGWLALQRQ